MNLLRKLKRKSSIIIALIILLGLLVLVLLLVVPVQGFHLNDVPKWVTNQLKNSNIQDWLEKRGVLESSTADVFIEDGYLRFTFKIDNNDKLKVIEFNRRLGVGGDYLDGVSIKLDPDSLNRLQPMLPVHVKLDFDDSKVSFSSQASNLLSPGFSGQNYNIATGSGKLGFQAKDAQNFELQIQDPEPVLQYATGSGQLHLSTKLNPLFPILEKVSSINLTVNGKNVQGEMRLK